MSTLRINTLSNAAGSKSVPVDTVVDGSAKAWVNFNGTGTVAIRAAFNVSSITDIGTGDYTVNFTTSMVDANYSQVCTSGQGSSSGNYFIPNIFYAPTTANCGLRVTTHTGTISDAPYVNVAIFR